MALRGGVAGLLAFAAAGFCGCVAEPMDPAAGALPLVVAPPTAPAGTDAATAAFYESILAQLLEAHADADLPRMQSLLGFGLRSATPAWARDRLEGLRALAKGLAFEQFQQRNATLRQKAAADASPHDIGAPLDFEFVLTAPPDGPWSLGGEAGPDPVAFRVFFVIREARLDGAVQRLEDEDVLRLPAALTMTAEPLVLPIRLDLGPSDAVRRDVEVQVELLPGYVQCGEDRAPVRRLPLAKAQAQQWPAGHDVIRSAPLKTLRRAQQLGDPAHFPHVRLAAEFAPPSERPEVVAALIEWVRLGRPDQALVAMAALAELHPEAGIAVGDRDAWLYWRQARR